MLCFELLTCVPEFSFWKKLSQNKLDIYKLNNNFIKITGNVKSSKLILDENSFENKKEINSIQGTIKIFNTLETFKKINKKNLLETFGTKIWDSFTRTKSLPIFNTFTMIVFADLKLNQFIYWVGYPTFKMTSMSISPKIILHNELLLKLEYSDFENKFSNLDILTGEISPLSLSKITNNNIIVILNFTTNIDYPTWLLRNLLCYFQCHGKTKIKLLFINSKNETRIVTLKIDKINTKPKIIGWEKNAGKMKPKIIKIKNEETNLNIKLMRWKMLPKLNIDKLTAVKCLLIGAGTLGCSVSRSLLSWGIKNISLIDCGKVSNSNPIRQSLYFNKDIGKFKVSVATDRLKEILPSGNFKGYNLEIPMPGHIIHDLEETHKNIILFDKLVQENDIVFILTDTRESRWLPTLFGNKYNKLVINVALGFDTFLVIRSDKKLGCYFCNDVIAPRNSTEKRTLDQQCTVTRPAVGNIASSLAVELLVAILQMNKKYVSFDSFNCTNNLSELGLIPHQIRGDISSYKYFLPHSEPFRYCTACSNTILNSYNKNGLEFLVRTFNNPDFLEEISGLEEFHKMTENIILKEF